MIISKTPLRISFFGGGTDFPDYYQKAGYGAVVSTTIDKYVYVAVYSKFDESVRVRYSENETVNDVSEIKHNIIREALKFYGIKKGIEVISMAEVTGQGTGLGSSSALDVGLLKCLWVYNPYDIRRIMSEMSPEYYARDACLVEINVLKYPIGKQDQYASAYGGLNYISFNAGESVDVLPINLTGLDRIRLEQRLMLFYTDMVRDSNAILSVQKQNIKDRMAILDEIRGLADMCYDYMKHDNLTHFGEILKRSWELKKQLAGQITNTTIDEIYQRALDAGAEGGKICGAGGGGFLLLYVPISEQTKVRKTVGLKEMKFKFESEGSKIIYRD